MQGQKHRWSGRARCVFGKIVQLVSAVALTGTLAVPTVWAEGSRTLYPAGYGGDGAGRANLNLSTAAGNRYLGIIPARTFLYVYAEAGEHILLGSRNRTADGVGAIHVFAPPAGQTAVDLGFGPRGDETPPEPAVFECDSGTIGLIETRAAELAGPRAVDGSDGGNTDRFTPCVYEVLADGVYGVLFSVGSSGGNPNGVIDPPASSTSSVSAWDVTVRSDDDSSLVDIDGRVFTYAFAGYTGGNGDGRRVYSTVYYVTDDGYRYAQIQRGFDPNAYVLYSNPQGFLDQGEPLYKSVRGVGHYLTSQSFPLAGIVPQRPQYPIFFSDVMSASGIDAVLDYLDIPSSPPVPQISGVEFSFPPTSATTTYVGMGGQFRFDAQDTISYQIVISHDGVNFDPAHPDNRVLAGMTQNGPNMVFWDGRDNSGVPFPPGGGFQFEVTGRNGEVHFPMLDVENNLDGGPTVTRLNAPGGPDSVVYFDDRGYVTRNGTVVGTLNGHLCGQPTWPQPSPNHSLTGIDSTDADWNGTGNYYRAWSGGATNPNPGQDCHSIDQYFGDAKALDLWTFEASEPGEGTSGSFDILDYADVTAMLSVPASVVPGGTVYAFVAFGNVGSLDAADTAYSVELPTGLAGGVICAGATCQYDSASGIVTILGLPGSLSPGQWTNVVTLEYTAFESGSMPVVATVTTTTLQPEPPNPQAPDTASGTTSITSEGTVADVLAQVSPPLVAAPGSTVNVPVTFRNLGPLEAGDLVYTLGLPPGTAGVSCAGATCDYDPVTGSITVTGWPNGLAAGASTALTLSYTAPLSGTVPVTASIQTSADEDNLANNSATGYTTVSTEPVADVTVSLSPPPVAVAGSTVNIPVTFRNLGPLPASDVTYALQLPSGLDDVVCSGLAVCSYDGGTGAVTVAGLPTVLDNGQVENLTIGYTAPLSGPVPIEASIATSTPESNEANNTAASQTAITVPDLAVTIGTPDVSGGLIEIPVTVVNQGDGIADGVTVEVTVPTGLSGVSCPAPAVCAYDAGTGVIVVTGLPSILAPGEQTAFLVQIPQSQVGQSIEVEVTVATTTPEANLSNNTDQGSYAVNAASIAPIPVFGPFAAGLLALLLGGLSIPSVRRRMGV